MNRILIAISLYLVSTWGLASSPPPSEHSAGSSHKGLTVSSSSKSCQSCHSEIYDQWKESFHAKATTSPAFRGMATLFNFSAGAKSARECLNCHATDVKLTGDYQARWQAIMDDKPNTPGVTCTACHSIRDVDKNNHDLLVPVTIKAVKTPFHNVERSALFKKEVMCSGCHDYNNSHAVQGDWERGVACCNTNRDFRKTKMAKDGVTCQTCHMAPGLDKDPNAWKKAISSRGSFKDTLFRLVNLGQYSEKKIFRGHRFPGSHDADLVKSSVKTKLTVESNNKEITLKATIKNLTGHSIPNGCPPRARIFLRLWLEDEDGFEIDSKQVEYGFNFIDKYGFEPVGVAAAVGRGFDHVIEAEKISEVTARFEYPKDSSEITAKASLTYVYFVMPPTEAQNRLQQGLIRQIQEGTQEKKDFILNVEIPSRMGAMNRLVSAYNPVVMWLTKQKIK